MRSDIRAYSAVELPGYRTVCANEVFARDFKRETSEGDVSLIDMVLIRRYNLVTEDNVIGYLMRKANELQTAAATIHPAIIAKSDNYSPLEKLIMLLPNEVIAHIVQGREDCINFLRRNATAPNIKGKTEQCLHVKYGILPEENISERKGRPELSSPIFYENALYDDDLRGINKLGKQWMAQLLLPDGRLPERSKVDILLDSGVHRSRLLDIDLIGYDSSQVKGVMDTIYCGLDSPEKILLLKDISREAIYEVSFQLIIRLYNNVQEAAKRAAGKIKPSDWGWLY